MPAMTGDFASVPQASMMAHMRAAQQGTANPMVIRDAQRRRWIAERTAAQMERIRSTSAYARSATVAQAQAQLHGSLSAFAASHMAAGPDGTARIGLPKTAQLPMSGLPSSFTFTPRNAREGSRPDAAITGDPEGSGANISKTASFLSGKGATNDPRDMMRPQTARRSESVSERGLLRAPREHPSQQPVFAGWRWRERPPSTQNMLVANAYTSSHAVRV